MKIKGFDVSQVFILSFHKKNSSLLWNYSSLNVPMASKQEHNNLGPLSAFSPLQIEWIN